MYHMTPEEIRQRFLLIDRIDGLLPYIILTYSIPWLILLVIRYRRNPMVVGGYLWWKLEWKLWGWWTVLFFVLDLVGHLLILAVFIYFFWRTFYAFY